MSKPGNGSGSTCWDEGLFRRLLAVETARARRAGRVLLVVVVSRPSDGGAGLPRVLTRCLRESDLVGWHRQGRRAAAVLTETDASLDTARLVGLRILHGLAREGTPLDTSGLRIRVHRYTGHDGVRGLERLLGLRGAATASRGRAASRRSAVDLSFGTPAGAAATRRHLA
jgi:hypothetical protein